MKVLIPKLNNLPIYFITFSLLIIALGAFWFGQSITGKTFFVRSHIDYKEFLLSVYFIVFSLFYFYHKGLSKAKYLFKINRIELSFLIFYVFASLSIFWAEDLTLFLNKWLMYSLAIVAYFFAKQMEHSEINFLKISFFSSLIVLIISAIGLSQYLYDFPSHDILARVNDTGSTFGNKNLAGHIIVLTFPLLIYYFLNTKKFSSFIFSSFVLIFTFFYIYFAATKAAWISLFLELIIIISYLFYRNKKFNFNLKKIVIFLLIILLSLKLIESSTYLNNAFYAVESAVETSKDEFSKSGARLNIWRAAFRFIQDSPFVGHGLGSFPHLLNLEGNYHRLIRVHNDIFELIVDLGAAGLILFLFFVYSVLKNQYKILMGKKESIFYFLIFIGLIGTSANLLVSFPYQLLPPMLIAAIIIGILSKKGSGLTSLSNLHSITLSPAAVKISFTFLLITLLYASYYFNNGINAPNDSLVNSGTKYHKFNKEKLNKIPRFYGQDQYLYTYYMDYFKAGYEDRAAEIMEIAISKNSENMYALRKLFEIYLKKRDFDKAKYYVDLMSSVSDYHFFILLSKLELNKYTNNKTDAIRIYEYYKNRFLGGDDTYPAILKYLVIWSVTLGQYGDTENLYNLTLNFDDLYEDLNLINSMAKFYAYTGRKSEGMKFYKIYADNIEKIIETGYLELLPENIIDYYRDN